VRSPDWTWLLRLHVGALVAVACVAGLHDASFIAIAGFAINVKTIKMQARILWVICVPSRTGRL